MDTVEDVIAHFGVRGMKWGIRRDRPKVDIRSQDAKNAALAKKIVRKHGTKALSNQELQALVTRMNLEKQYATLMAQNPSRIRRGHTVVKELLSVGKTFQDAYNLANGPMARGVANALAQHNIAEQPKSSPKTKVKLGFT